MKMIKKMTKNCKQSWTRVSPLDGNRSRASEVAQSTYTENYEFERVRICSNIWMNMFIWYEPDWTLCSYRVNMFISFELNRSEPNMFELVQFMRSLNYAYTHKGLQVSKKMCVSFAIFSAHQKFSRFSLFFV